MVKLFLKKNQNQTVQNKIIKADFLFGEEKFPSHERDIQVVPLAGDCIAIWIREKYISLKRWKKKAKKE